MINIIALNAYHIQYIRTVCEVEHENMVALVQVQRVNDRADGLLLRIISNTYNENVV